MRVEYVLPLVNECFSDAIQCIYWLHCYPGLCFIVFFIQPSAAWSSSKFLILMYIYINSEFKDIKILYVIITEKRLPSQLILQSLTSSSTLIAGKFKQTFDTEEWKPFLTGPLTGPLTSCLVLFQGQLLLKIEDYFKPRDQEMYLFSLIQPPIDHFPFHLHCEANRLCRHQGIYSSQPICCDFKMSLTYRLPFGCSMLLYSSNLSAGTGQNLRLTFSFRSPIQNTRTGHFHTQLTLSTSFHHCLVHNLCTQI